MKKYYLQRIIAAATVLTLTVSSLSIGLNAQAESTQDQIDQAEDEKDELEEEKDRTESMLDDLKSGKYTVSEQLDALNDTLAAIALNLEDINDRILLKEADIAEAEAELLQAEADEESQYQSMVTRVKLMYERNETDTLNAILSAGSLYDILNTADYYEKVEEYDKQQLEKYKETRAAVEDKKAALESEYETLLELKTDAEEESAKTSEAIAQTQAKISAYNEQISEAEEKARQYEDEIAEKEKDLEYLYQKLEEEKKKSREAAEGTWRDISEVTFEEGDRYLLANLIYCEAGGEPYEGQCAVGAVVVNRVLSGCFPDTVTGVIYQTSQFSPVASGRLAIALAENRATESCYNAADAAMSGYTNVGTCVYFRTPIEGLEGIQIGGHIFY